MSICEQCSYIVDCIAGCGIVCRNDCTDCIMWCEPHSVMLMRNVKEGDKARTRVSVREGFEQRDDFPACAEDEELRVCFNGISRGTLAQLLNSMSDRQVRTPIDRADEKLSDCLTASLRQLAEKYSLIVE